MGKAKTYLWTFFVSYDFFGEPVWLAGQTRISTKDKETARLVLIERGIPEGRLGTIRRGRRQAGRNDLAWSRAMGRVEQRQMAIKLSLHAIEKGLDMPS